MKQKHSDPGRTIMLDVGATLNCSVAQLIQFATMGIHYAKEVFEIEQPRIGLLNIGEEETKGHDVLVETYSMLKKIKKRVDYSEYGGAPILGFEKLVIKAHGRSKAKAIKNALLMAEGSL